MGGWESGFLSVRTSLVQTVLLISPSLCHIVGWGLKGRICKIDILRKWGLKFCTKVSLIFWWIIFHKLPSSLIDHSIWHEISCVCEIIVIFILVYEKLQIRPFSPQIFPNSCTFHGRICMNNITLHAQLLYNKVFPVYISQIKCNLKFLWHIYHLWHAGP